MPPLIEPKPRGTAAAPGLPSAFLPAAPTARAERSPAAFLQELLAEQQTLTAVDRFSRQSNHSEGPAQAKYYRDLIPLSRPRAGEQYAFTVDLDRCSGCKACVTACHSLNGLDEAEMWRSVGLLVSESTVGGAKPVYQHVTTACHHCVEPSCADGCPVLAYEKDPVTGIVRHLDDQCIGCQYCVMKCPYDVPKYSKAKGIVRKCDMCHSRLEVGEAPACVQACPHEAIRITVVSQATIAETYRPEGKPADAYATANAFLAGSPPPEITLPATRYFSRQPLPSSARAGNHFAPRLEPAHWPLVFMLVLTQLAAGLHLLFGILFSAGWTEPLPVLARVALCGLLVGLVASVAHLGRPLKAWRACLGWRRSWMSREVIAFGVYATLAGVLVLSPGNALLAQATALTAIAAVACSVMIYVDTKRPAWRPRVVFTQFFGTVLLLGTTGGSLWAEWLAPKLAPILATIALAIRTALFAWEWAALRSGRGNAASPLHWRAQIAFALLQRVLVGQATLFVASNAFLILAIFNNMNQGPLWAALAFLSTVTSQILDRYSFFAASAPPRMPGAVA